MVKGCVSLPTCCQQDADCTDGGTACTTEACVDGTCASTFTDGPACCKSSTLAAAFFNGGWDGFQVVQDADPGDGVGWAWSPGPSGDAPGALHYGNAVGTYDSGKQNSAAVESPSFLVAPQWTTVLSFRVLLDTEWAHGVGSIDWDRLTVTVVDPESKLAPQVVWSSTTGTPPWWTSGPDGQPTGPAWIHVTKLDLGLARGRLVRLRFHFDTLDGDANGYGGVSLDDITVLTTCSP